MKRTLAEKWIAHGAKRIICLWITLSAIYCFCSAHAGAEDGRMLLYIIGSELESEEGAATEDLYEIIRTTRDVPFPAAVHLGGSPSWWLPGIEDGSCCDLVIENGELRVQNEYPNRNCATEEELYLFLNAYGKSGGDLVVWGHGADNGVGYDRMNGDDCLTVSEIRQAVSKSGLRFRMIGFDACSMASLEMMLTLAPYADYIAASPGPENLKGWNYKLVMSCLSSSGGGSQAEEEASGLPLLLREVGRTPLTVIRTDELEECIPSLIKVFDTSPGFQLPVDLALLLETCEDREAAELVGRFPQGQSITVTGMLQDDGAVSPELAESYRSFVNRR